MTGLEPATSYSQSKHSDQTELHLDISTLRKRIMELRQMTLVQCVGPAPTGGYHMSKPPILIWLNAYHLATLTLHIIADISKGEQLLQYLLGFRLSKHISSIRT